MTTKTKPGLICLLITSAFLIACEQYKAPDPDGPNGSWWVGGVDGGVYIYIEDDKNTKDNIYLGTIYYDSDKSIWYRGKLKYSKNSTFDYKNKNLYSGWDGERLFLKDNSYLTAIEKILPL